jgi:hypothetical protein
MDFFETNRIEEIIDQRKRKGDGGCDRLLFDDDLAGTFLNFWIKHNLIIFQI